METKHIFTCQNCMQKHVRCGNVVSEPINNAVLQEADPERLLNVSLNRVQEEIYGINILQSKHILAMCEFLSRGLDLAVRYKKDKNRIVLNELDPKDLMAEWEKNHSGDVRRAGDSHYEPGEWAEWQETASDDMEYFRSLEEKHRKTG